MPSIKVSCPICPEKVYESGLGKHFLSKTHAAHLLKENQKLRPFLQALKTKCYMTNGKNEPPLFSITKTESYHICLSCKKCYKNEDSNIGVKKHYEKSPKCKEDGIANLEAFLSPVVKVKGGNETLEKIAKLETDLKYYKEVCDRSTKKFQDASCEVDELKEIIKMAIDPKFDITADGNINKFKEYLESDSGNQGFYMGRFKYLEEE